MDKPGSFPALEDLPWDGNSRSQMRTELLSMVWDSGTINPMVSCSIKLFRWVYGTQLRARCCATPSLPQRQSSDHPSIQMEGGESIPSRRYICRQASIALEHLCRKAAPTKSSLSIPQPNRPTASVSSGTFVKSAAPLWPCPTYP